jgi:hypothetical protein
MRLSVCVQVLRLVLHGCLRGARSHTRSGVCLPHGAESGFDPYRAYEDINEETFYQYIHGPIQPRGAPGEWVRVVRFSRLVAFRGFVGGFH